VIIAVALAAAALTGGRARLRADWPPGLWGLAVPWLVVLPAGRLTATGPWAPAGRAQELCAPAEAQLSCRIMPTGGSQVILESGRSAREWVLVG
jgi:hypothetical protein